MRIVKLGCRLSDLKECSLLAWVISWVTIKYGNRNTFENSKYIGLEYH